MHTYTLIYIYIYIYICVCVCVCTTPSQLDQVVIKRYVYAKAIK